MWFNKIIKNIYIKLLIILLSYKYQMVILSLEMLKNVEIYNFILLNMVKMVKMVKPN